MRLLNNIKMVNSHRRFNSHKMANSHRRFNHLRTLEVDGMVLEEESEVTNQVV